MIGPQYRGGSHVSILVPPEWMFLLKNSTDRAAFFFFPEVNTMQSKRARLPSVTHTEWFLTWRGGPRTSTRNTRRAWIPQWKGSSIRPTANDGIRLSKSYPHVTAAQLFVLCYQWPERLLLILPIRWTLVQRTPGCRTGQLSGRSIWPAFLQFPLGSFQVWRAFERSGGLLPTPR